MSKKMSKISLLAAVQAILLLFAMVLSIISSNTAYALNNITLVVVTCVVAVVLAAAMSLLNKKLPGVLVDLLFFVTTVCTSTALCTMIQGRTKLMGYVYFSDLESSNPVAILAMNLAIAAWVLYFAALVLNIVIGFSRHEKD
jgi:glucan phosphoethanolaminetransferase (alkaline phosphatase superfamily)